MIHSIPHCLNRFTLDLHFFSQLTSGLFGLVMLHFLGLEKADRRNRRDAARRTRRRNRRPLICCCCFCCRLRQ